MREKLDLSWYYGWTRTAQECDGGGEFVPMIWGHAKIPQHGEQDPDMIRDHISSFVDKGYEYVLGFNEPGNENQANISVAKALELWPAFMNPDIQVGSPATTGNAKGRAWMDAFMAGVEDRGLRVDFIAIHWYGWNEGSCEKTIQLERYIEWAEQWGLPIWLTEWGCGHDSNPDAETVENFYAASLEMFKDHPLVERYAWYPWIEHNELVNGEGALTPLGKRFAAAPAYR